MKRFLIGICWLIIGSVEAQDTFHNPVLPSGPDPWNIYKDGYYYYTQTGGDKVELWKTKNLADLKNAERKVVYRPPANTKYSHQLWAPEIHFLNGKWYIYVAADDGKNKNHRMFVLENDSQDPLQGTFKFKGQITDPTDKWAIDGTVFEYNKKLYYAWSGWESNENKAQNIYVALMKNPWTIKGKRVMLSTPEYIWERNGIDVDTVKDRSKYVFVNEGPQTLMNNDGKLFMLYSASGCWTDHYSLGLLSFSGKGNILDSKQWTKKTTPVFETSVENKVFAPGHNSFFKSPDGKEDWILYHANSKAKKGCGNERSPRIQKFTWHEDGTPNFGVPLNTAIPLVLPSGTVSQNDKI